MDDLSNRVIKSYELKECVGAGGFGQVYRAYQPSVGREVAVKVILPQHANQPDFIRRFEVEAQLIAHLEHPHIVPMYDYWREPDGAFLVMRWLKGNLRSAIQRGPWSVEAASRLLDEIAGALTVAHREGVIHRDIKPDNILLDEDENAYLADFGIAKDLNVGSNTEEGAIVGSLAYITPEQISGEVVTSRSDIYSLGLVMYEVLVSQKPFPNATTPVEWFNAHLNTSLPHLNMQRPNLPAALNEVLQTATAKDPAHRYPNVLRFAAAFRAASPAPQRGPVQPLAEPLTERELDILRLMVEGLSNQEIAQKLFLTIGTVKWYVNQIYSKLDVHSRHQAVERARQLALIVEMGEPASLSETSMTVQAEPEQRQALPISVPRTDFVNPYKGLRAFQEADAHDFFGRAALTEQFLTRLMDQGNASQFLAVVGPSGSGKSSVVKAGLIPALRRGALPNSERCFITEMLPGTHPLEELEAALLRVAVTSPPGLLDQLAEDRRGLVRAAKRVLPADQNIELILVIDQFEELFTLLPDESVRAHFIDNILAAVTDPRSRIRVILTLRADFYDKPLLYPRLAELMRSHTEVVVPLTSAELERAIAGPAERIRLQFEPGLVATIIKDIGEQPGTLPLLQYALTELFERREGVTLTLDAYKNSGGISGSLARRADELYGDLEAAGQSAARQLFLRLITLGEGTEDTRRRALQTELSLLGNERIVDEVINAFVQYRLLTLDRDPVTRGPTVEIAHEALIREWGHLREWLTESREDLRIQRRLMAATTEWEHSKYERSFLASGARLAQFETLLSDSDLALNATEKAYLDASIKEREQQIVEEQKRQAREKALERRSSNFLRGLVGVLLVATLGAIGLTFVAQQNALRADRNAAESQNVALVAGSQAALAIGNTDLAIALALNGVTLNPTSAPAQVALGEAAYSPGTIRRFIGHTDQVSDVAFSPDGYTAISIANDGIMIVWDVATGAIIRRFPSGHTGKYFRMSLSPDGRTTLSGGTDGLVILDDPATGKIIRRFEGHTGAVEQVSFSPDGQMALSASDDKTLILWDVATGAIIRRFTGHTAAVVGVAFSADGRTALSASDDQTLILWDVATGTQLRQFTGAYPASYVEIRRDGRYAVTASHENTTILLWDMTTGQVIRRLKGHTGPVTGIKYSPDGKYILSGSDDGSMILWDAESGDLVRRLGRHDNSVKGVAFSPDGRYALSASFDHTLRLWDLGEGYIIRRFAGHKNWISVLQISRDGQTAVTASWDGTAKLWDLQTGQELRSLTGTGQLGGASFSPDGHTALISSADSSILWNVDSGEIVKRFAVPQPNESFAVLSPDGRTFLTSFWSDNSVWLWDVATGKVIRRLVGHTANVIGMAFSPDGRTALTGDSGGGIILWDLESGQPVRHFVGQTDLVGALQFSKDGRTALSWGAVNGSNLWDVASGTILRHFDGGEVFSPDERTVFGAAGTALGANAAVLVDVATGTVIRRYTGFAPLVIASSFTPDGKSVLVGFQDGSLELWRIDSPDELIAWTRANRYIAELPCDQRLLYKLTTSCDANAATPTATPYPTVTLTTGTNTPWSPYPQPAPIW